MPIGCCVNCGCKGGEKLVNLDFHGLKKNEFCCFCSSTILWIIDETSNEAPHTSCEFESEVFQFQQKC